MNKVVFDYLKEHKDKYNLDDLKKEIMSKGYSEADYDAALSAVQAQEPKKFKPGEVSRLPNSQIVPEKKKHFGWVGYLLLFLLLIVISFMVVVVLNFLDIDVFGFNFFKLFEFFSVLESSFL